MFVLILSFLYTVFAQESSSPHVYSREYLRGLKRVEKDRIQTEYIDIGIAYIEKAVFSAAKRGLVKYTTEPFESCEEYTKRPRASPNGIRIDKEICENIINGIKTLVSERFPDSELLYDINTKQYTLKWD